MKVGRLSTWLVEMEASGYYAQWSTSGCSEQELVVMSLFYVEFPLVRSGLIHAAMWSRPWIDELDQAYARLGAKYSLEVLRSIWPCLNKLLLSWDSGDQGVTVCGDLEEIGIELRNGLLVDADGVNLLLKKYFLANHSNIRGAAAAASLIYRP